jgi:hypothetical protein
MTLVPLKVEADCDAWQYIHKYTKFVNSIALLDVAVRNIQGFILFDGN